MTMFKSLKSWATIPITIHPFGGFNGAGDIVFMSDVPSECYAEHRVKVVADRSGKEVVSNTTIYIDATAYNISDHDDITFEGKRRRIKSLDAFYDGNIRSIWVVHI